jgi:hypothetical protein
MARHEIAIPTEAKVYIGCFIKITQSLLSGMRIGNHTKSIVYRVTLPDRTEPNLT